MPARRRARAPLNADINVTSLVDVAFVLLIIFMITAPMMQGGVEVRLPRAEARAMEPRQGLVVSVDRRGRVYIDDAPFAFADFRASFRAVVARRKPSAIYLRADRGVPYGDVVRVLAIIRASGVQDVGLVAETEDVVR
jgi:biopolymer transport protein ExbD/biopolymer transport protein TolR